MTIHYLGISEFAAVTGLTRNTIATYRRKGLIPTPDVVIEEAGRATTAGWTEQTVRGWMRDRSTKRGRPPAVRWVEDTVDGHIIILTEGTSVDELAAWLIGSAPHPAEMARKILKRPSRSLGCGLEIRSASRRATVTPSVTLRDLLRIAEESRVTCGDADASQIATVLANRRPEEYGEMILAHMQ
jgi:hypothetical protein